MRVDIRSRRCTNAQTLVFFLLAFGTIFLLCGLAIDSGLLYLAKARMSRAVDGAALAAVGNFQQSTNPATNRVLVAGIMRNFALANFTSLATTDSSGHYIPTTTTEVPGTTTVGGVTTTTYTYNFNDNTFDPNGQPRRYVQVVLETGAGGQITSATCSARCPVQTYFIGYASGIIGGFQGISSLKDLKVSSSAVATRNPRLIMVVLDRSSSMLAPGGGAYGLAAAVVTFMNFFQTSSDYIGIVSFSGNARLEMPLTTNFLIAGTNNLFESGYQIQSNYAGAEAIGEYSSPYGQPAVDPEQDPSEPDYDSNYSSYAQTGVRRLKFGGQTGADDGIRLALEQMMNNSGFYNPNVVKYMVIFTDGAWNAARTLVAAPGYTNVVTVPNIALTNEYVSNSTWNGNLDDTIANTNTATAIVYMPTLSPTSGMTNAIMQVSLDGTANNHIDDTWQSRDSSGLEPLGPNSNSTAVEGVPIPVATNTFLFQTNVLGVTFAVFTKTVNIWLPPGSVDHWYSGGALKTNFVSNLNSPTNTVTVQMSPGDSNVLVVPGYLIDGVVSDSLDLPVSYIGGFFDQNYYRENNYDEPFMWPDDTNNVSTAAAINNYGQGGSAAGVVTDSVMRNLMFRNYANLLTGFIVYRADDPLGLGIEHFTGAQRPLYGLGPYYPCPGFYWPFDLVGNNWDGTYALINPLVDPDLTLTDYARHLDYSINMLTTNAAPEQTGELFYHGTNAVLSSATAQSFEMQSASDWQSQIPSWLAPYYTNMTTDPVIDSNTVPSPADWRPSTFVGVKIGTTNSVTSASEIVETDMEGSGSSTGGYTQDQYGNVYKNCMAWSGRPTHYYDFSNSKWVAVQNNHVPDIQFQPLCTWKAQEYAWHARNLGVTIYTVGYGSDVNASQQVTLAQVANSTNTTAGNPQSPYTPGIGTSMPYNPAQPIGQQFYATTTNDISNDFYQVGQAINAALTQ